MDKKASNIRTEKFQNLELLFNSVLDYALILLSPQGHVIEWNKGAEEIFGYRSVEMEGRHFGTLYSLDEISTNKPLICLQEAASSGSHAADGWRVSRKSASFFVHQTTTAIKSSQKQLIGFSIVIRDLTKEKQIVDSLNTAISKQEEFIGIASHELKTPLTSLTGYFDIIEIHIRSGNTSLVGDLLLKGRKQLTRLTNLINNLLDASKIQAGKIQFESVEFNLHDIIKESISNASFLYPSHEINLKGKINVPVKGDASRLDQVLNNLLSNAVKYSPKSDKVLIEVVVITKEVRVSVTDYGIGIPRDKQSRLFQRFYRVDNFSYNFQGLGLGLYISAEIIKRHGGTIWVRSEPGKGSTFFFTLPIN